MQKQIEPEAVDEVRRDTIELMYLNVLRQPRTEFPNIDELADSISSLGLLSEPIIAHYTKQAAKDHLWHVNQLWDSVDYTLDDLAQQPRGGYIILIAGERRFRAISKLGWSEVRAQIWVNPDPFIALRIQFNENLHEPIVPEREAEAYDQFYTLHEIAGRDISVAELARKVNRSESTIRNALKFARLSPEIKDMVHEGFIKYGHALELMRLKNAGMDQDTLEWYAKFCATEDLTVEELGDVISQRLNELEQGQETLFDGELSEDERESKMRRVVAKNLAPRVAANSRYFRRLAEMSKQGLLGEPGSPYSGVSPARRLEAEVVSIEATLLHFGPKDLSDAKREKLLNRVENVQEALNDSQE